jgi:hypothetical protein
LEPQNFNNIRDDIAECIRDSLNAPTTEDGPIPKILFTNDSAVSYYKLLVYREKCTKLQKL